MIFLSHLTLRAPMYPGTTARNGKPCSAVSGLSFIFVARSTPAATTSKL
jgi:hypothetical protein